MFVFQDFVWELDSTIIAPKRWVRFAYVFVLLLVHPIADPNGAILAMRLGIAMAYNLMTSTLQWCFELLATMLASAFATLTFMFLAFSSHFELRAAMSAR
jgi:hypothetical protein